MPDPEGRNFLAPAVRTKKAITEHQLPVTQLPKTRSKRSSEPEYGAGQTGKRQWALGRSGIRSIEVDAYRHVTKGSFACITIL